MPQTYLENCIDEALKKARGNQTKARQLLTSMAIEDDQLLLALSRPHLPAIVAHAIGHHADMVKNRKKGTKNLGTDIPAVPEDAKGGGFGLDLLKALGGNNVPKFGKEDAAPPVKKVKASSQHVNALKLMASKSKTKPR